MEPLTFPPLPDGATVALAIGKAVVACSPEPGRPGVYVGHPGDLEPPEDPDLGPLYLLLRSKGRWVPLRLEDAPHIEEQIWGAFNALVDESWQEYQAELAAERGLFC